jgi:hypothetical protein
MIQGEIPRFARNDSLKFSNFEFRISIFGGKEQRTTDNAQRTTCR